LSDGTAGCRVLQGVQIRDALVFGGSWLNTVAEMLVVCRSSLRRFAVTMISQANRLPLSEPARASVRERSGQAIASSGIRFRSQVAFLI
jgi:hypothetical protein